MAKHFLRNDIYWIDYRYGGKRIRQSLKTSDAKAAKALLARLEDNLQRVENGSLAIPNGIDDTEFLLSDGRSRSKPDKSSEIRTLRQLCNGYLAGLRNDSLEASTIKGIKIHIKHLLRDLRKSTLLSHINLDLLQEYVDRRSKQRGRYGNKIRPATIKKELVTLRIMWKWARRHDLTPTQPVAVNELQYSKVRAKPPFQTFGEIKNRVKRGGLSKVEILELSGSIFLTQDEVEKLLLHVNRVTRQPFVYPMFAFAAYTGARRSELLRSKVEDIDFES